MSRIVRLVVGATILSVTVDPRLAGAQPAVSDKTGTNPLNLQQTVVVSNDFQSLPDALFTNVTQYEYLVPFAARRVRVGLAVPFVATNVTGRTEFGLSDIGASVTWIPWMREGRGLVAGTDVTWNTATHDALGADAHTVTVRAAMPVVSRRGFIVTPGVRYQSSVGSDPAARRRLTLGVATVWRTATRWVGAEPEVVFDHERDERRGSVGFEYGHVLFSGVGTYLRPRVGLGSTFARPFDWALEVGFRVIP